MTYCIADLNITLNGHKFGFVYNLLHYVGQYHPGERFVFFVNRSDEFSLQSNYPHVTVVMPDSVSQARFQSETSLLRKSQLEWIWMQERAEALQAQRLILLELDLYQIAIGRATTPFAVSGIWFRPYARMQPESPGLRAWFSYLRSRWQKKMVMQIALRNSALDKVFILNDEEMPKWLGQRFYTLPDPWFDYPTEKGFNLRAHYNIPDHHLVLLQFGYADERKNNENIIDALNGMASEAITLLIVGKFKPGYAAELAKRKTGPFQLVMRDAFVPDAEMESTFQQSDVILRMNVNYFGSSGVVGIAARYHKPVVVSNTGVMAELVQKYRLGETVDPKNLKAIRAIFERYRTALPQIDGAAYRDTHDLKAFAEALLQE